MGNKVHHFNLPPIKTCTPSLWCLEKNRKFPNCYALKNNFLLQNVITSAQKRFELSKEDDFSDKMISYIHRNKVEYFRIHGSGDFYSEFYVKKWIEIIKNCPQTKFQAKTKRRDLTEIIQELNSLPNIIIRESLDTSMQSPKMNLPLATLTSVKKENSYFCPNKCDLCGYYCWNNNGNIHFDEH